MADAESNGKDGKRIPIGKGKFAVVDECDFDRLSKFRWRAIKVHSGNVYAFRTTRYVRTSRGKRRREIIFMHSEILPGCRQIDHKDGDGLNNRRPNLRPCTQAQNNGNSRKRRTSYGRKPTSQYKGVSLHGPSGLWRANIGVNGKQKYLGYFKNERDAALAYDAAAKTIFGEFARMNFRDQAIA